MSEIYVEGIHEDTLYNFELKILNTDSRQERFNLINDMSRYSISAMGSAFCKLIKESDFDTETKDQLFKWINDTGYND